MKNLRVSSSFLHCRQDEDFAEHIKRGLLFLKETGFDAADCSLKSLDLTENGWQRQVEQMLAAGEECGIRFEQCHLPFGGVKTVVTEAFAEKMHHAIDAAVALGVKHAVMHPNTTTIPLLQHDRAALFDEVVGHLAPFVEHAKRVGLDVVVENMRVVPGMRLSHRYCQDPDELCDVADALGIGVCWDFGHAHQSGVKQSEALAYIGKRLKVLHVNDNAAIDDEHLPPFLGSVDWRDAMHGLALAGFEGLFNFELAKERIPAAMRKPFATYVRATATELLTYIE